MKVVEEAPWSWMLLAEESERFLSVVVGAAAPYEVEFALEPEEIAAYEREGTAYLEKLAERVLVSPGAFQTRHIADFRERPGVEEAIAAWRQSGGALKPKG
jgi:hypothetical protein